MDTGKRKQQLKKTISKLKKIRSQQKLKLKFYQNWRKNILKTRSRSRTRKFKTNPVWPMKQESIINSSSSIISRRKVKSSWSISRSVLEQKWNYRKNYKKNQEKYREIKFINWKWMDKSRYTSTSIKRSQISQISEKCKNQ